MIDQVILQYDIANDAWMMRLRLPIGSMPSGGLAAPKKVLDTLKIAGLINDDITREVYKKLSEGHSG